MFHLNQHLKISEVQICCSVGLKGAVQRFGLFAKLSSTQLSSEFLLCVRTLALAYTDGENPLALLCPGKQKTTLVCCLLFRITVNCKYVLFSIENL